LSAYVITYHVSLLTSDDIYITVTGRCNINMLFSLIHNNVLFYRRQLLAFWNTWTTLSQVRLELSWGRWHHFSRQKRKSFKVQTA